MSSAASGFATYAGWRTRILHVAGDGPTFVLLHGFGDSADTWSAVIDELAVLGRSAIAADLPGFGRADDLADGPILPQLDRFVAALAGSESDPEGVILVGNSLGALAALRAASQGVPARGVIPIAEPSCGDNWTIRQFRSFPEPLWIRLLSVQVSVPRGLATALITAAARRALGRRARINDPAAARRVGEYLGRRRGGHPWVVRTARRLAVESENCHDFGRIAVPVWVVHGARDLVIPVNSAEAVHAALPQSRLVVRPEWGHCPQLQDGAGVARLLVDFADDLPDPSANLQETCSRVTAPGSCSLN